MAEEIFSGFDFCDRGKMTISANTLFSGGRLLSAVQLLPLVVERAGTTVLDYLNPGMRGQELQRMWVGPGVGFQAQVIQAD